MTALAETQNGALAKPDTFEIGPEERALLVGDLGLLKPEQRASLVVKICESVGLNPLTRPFEYIVLNNKLTLYARKDATEQLRRRHTVSLKIVGRENVEGVFVVTARATMPNGRDDESIGAVPVGGLKGEAMANAIMKAETKAKRRVTLSICGLGMLDELELETIPPTQIRHVDDTPPAPVAIAPASSLLVSPDTVSEIRSASDALGYDAARLAKGAMFVSDGTTEVIENLLQEQGNRLLKLFTRALSDEHFSAAKKADEEVRYCPDPNCGAQLSPKADVQPHTAECKLADEVPF